MSLWGFCMNLSQNMCIYEEVTNRPAVASLCPEAHRNWNFPEYLFKMLDVCESQDWGHSKSVLWYPIFVAKIIDFRAYKFDLNTHMSYGFCTVLLELELRYFCDLRTKLTGKVIITDVIGASLAIF